MDRIEVAFEPATLEWLVRHPDDAAPLSRHRTQDDAERAARRHAREHGEHVVAVRGHRGALRYLLHLR